MDRQIKAEKAWVIPYRISEKLQGFSMDTVRPLSLADVIHLMTQPEPLHRFFDKMSGFFQPGVQWISNEYADDAARLGLCATDASVEQVIYKARALYPELPEMIGLPSWQTGRNWPSCQIRRSRFAGSSR